MLLLLLLFCVDVAHSFADHTTSAWHGREAAAGPVALGSRCSSAGHTETGRVRKSHLEIITTEQL